MTIIIAVDDYGNGEDEVLAMKVRVQKYKVRTIRSTGAEVRTQNAELTISN